VQSVPKASDLKRGDVIEYKGQPHLVKKIEVRSPSSRGAATLYKVRLNHAKTGQKVDESFKGDDMLPDIDFERRSMQFSYIDGENYIFMDESDYSQHQIAKDELGDDHLFIVENLQGIMGLLVDSQLIGIELPSTVIMEITDTTPVIKGASASARTKPATFSTGLVVQVPEYLGIGESIKINTDEVSFVSRA